MNSTDASNSRSPSAETGVSGGNQTGQLKKRLTHHFLFLGKSGPTFNCYKIRFRLRRKTPTFSDFCRSCSDCLRTKNVDEPRSSTCLAGGEVFFVLHLAIIILGGVDLCLGMRTWHSTLHLSLSTVAAILTTIQLALRIVYIQTYRIKTVISDLSLSADGYGLMAELMQIKSIIRKILTLFGMCAVLINVVLFPLFYVFLHLGWSHITNNVLVMSFARVHEVLQSLLDREVVQSDVDSHKAVLFEAAQLLQEQFSVPSLEARQAYQDKASRFLMALRKTPCYVRPEYMFLEEARPRSLSTSSHTDDESRIPAEHISSI